MVSVGPAPITQRNRLLSFASSQVVASFLFQIEWILLGCQAGGLIALAHMFDLSTDLQNVSKKAVFFDRSVKWFPYSGLCLKAYLASKSKNFPAIVTLPKQPSPLPAA